MRLSVDRNDIGYHPLARTTGNGVIVDVLLNGVSVLHLATITADDDDGILIRYKTWPWGSFVVEYDRHNNPYVPRIEMRGKVKFILKDGWMYINGGLVYMHNACQNENVNRIKNV